MTSDSSDIQKIRNLLDERVAGHSLPRAFYCDEYIYQADLNYIWRRDWNFVGFTCQLPKVGDYMTFQLGDDSIIVVRTSEDTFSAFHNICRHRGSLLCDLPVGNARRFVCPYHQWTYDLDGTLASCRGMSHTATEDLDLVNVQLRELSGMLFVCLAESPPEFEPAVQLIAPIAAPQGMEKSKVAQIVDYEVAANWKLVWENNRECYHCNANHPQYIKANFDIFDKTDLNERIQEKLESQIALCEAEQRESGISVTHTQSGIAVFPDADNNLWYSANRTVLAPGFVTESLDGKQVAPLMGAYASANVGTLRIRTVPNMWNHSSCDHVVATRLLPVSVGKTQVRVIWLVDENAIEGRDYELEKILPFWQLTSEQDWELCERAQKGVRSSKYRPGPYSIEKEYNVEAFVRWYLGRLRSQLGRVPEGR